MKVLLVLISALLTATSWCQTTVICDSVSKHPIPFATIVNGSDGLYADLNGEAIIPRTFKSYTVSHIGYRSKTVDNNQKRDTLWMSPAATVLKEVIIKSGIDKQIVLGYPKKNKRMTSLPIKPNLEMITRITPNPDYIGLKLKTIQIPLRRVKHYNKTDKLIKGKTSIFRLNIYSLNETDALKLIYQSNYTTFVMSDSDDFMFNLNGEDITLFDGMCIGVEMIGNIDDNGRFIDDGSYTRPMISPDAPIGYEAESYVKTSFGSSLTSASNLNKLGDHLADYLKAYKDTTTNMVLVLTVLE